MRLRVGICEDDAELRSVLSRALEAEDFDVTAVRSGHQAVKAFTGNAPDALVLDIGLPDSDGRDVCQALRARGVDAPVIFLTAADALTDRLSGFNAGGDDYLTKPFALEELLVRIRALLRRSSDGPAPLDGGLVLDPAAHAVQADGRQAPLTPTEFRLLAALAARPKEVVRRRELVAAGWPDGAIVHDNTLDTYIARLRRKLRALETSQEIATARRVGYVLR
jgi:two-component system response regulator MprA